MILRASASPSAPERFVRFRASAGLFESLPHRGGLVRVERAAFQPGQSAHQLTPSRSRRERKRLSAIGARESWPMITASYTCAPAVCSLSDIARDVALADSLRGQEAMPRASEAIRDGYSKYQSAGQTMPGYWAERSAYGQRRGCRLRTVAVADGRSRCRPPQRPRPALRPGRAEVATRCRDRATGARRPATMPRSATSCRRGSSTRCPGLRMPTVRSAVARRRRDTSPDRRRNRA